ncbi:hypothetical protein B0H19DRAFT_1082319 [Mycena capillaripes]|nr:hypothetical protein B0H19DRAFT_1082319 [Mycena capillaripes]
MTQPPFNLKTIITMKAYSEQYVRCIPGLLLATGSPVPGKQHSPFFPWTKEFLDYPDQMRRKNLEGVWDTVVWKWSRIQLPEMPLGLGGRLKYQGYDRRAFASHGMEGRTDSESFRTNNGREGGGAEEKRSPVRHGDSRMASNIAGPNPITGMAGQHPGYGDSILSLVKSQVPGMPAGP